MNANLKTRIMRRAYTIWALRVATSPRVVKLLILIASVWQFKEHVFVSRVFANMPSPIDPSATYWFFSSAIVNAQLIVQVSMLAGAAFGLLVLRDIVDKRQATYWF
ncbi:MAG: hypothetical protein HZA94_00165 [Candidatus Vogelbacteria bacterium]|nr:hypothetical protein [Candidatus Vogelbacteria bacterium]